MTDVGLALLRSIKTLGQWRVWLLVFGPAVLGVAGLGRVGGFLSRMADCQPGRAAPAELAGRLGVLWLAKLAAALGGWLLILAAAFVTAMLLAAIFVMPLLLEVVSSTDYPELARLGKDSLAGAVVNSLVAVLVFTVGWLLTLPLWLIPGLALLLPVLWMAWLTRRTFAYDALSVHATVDEWRLLRRQHGFPMLLLGVILALLAHIPVIGLLTPTLAALAYTHYCLEALRRLRQGAVVTVIGQQPILKELR
jgi:CysZ protein